MLENTYTLENGIKIPKLGLGTWFIDDFISQVDETADRNAGDIS